MNFGANAAIGLEGLRVHKLRSFLTSLGIIFGVAAVIAMLSIGEGARREALEQIRLLGTNNILVRSKPSPPPTGERTRPSFSTGLVAADGEAIREICPFVERVVPQWEKSAFAQAGSARTEARVIGTTPDFLVVFGYRLREGSFLLPEQLVARANVCVLADDVKKALFPFEAALGKRVKLDDQWFEVIGVMERQLSPGSAVPNLQVRNLNLDVYLPLTTAREKLERRPPGASSNANMNMNDDDAPIVRPEALDQIAVRVSSEEGIDEAAAVVRRILSRRHFGVVDYEIVVPEALVRQSQKTQRIFNVVMGAIAGISLLVGGIGIMNIMLASVWERTKEIGIRRALGATRRDVLSQFLFEASVLSIAGGLVGIAVGIGLTRAITLFAAWKTVVSIPAVVAAFVVSAAVGISFGYYPAKRAALQDPIESLRYE